jgi:copper chaperone CopZ
MSTTSTFKTTGMHCPSCSMLVTMNLEELEGVQSVSCDHVTGDTVVIHDEAAVDADHIRQTISDSGYDAELVG